jgi:DNA-binding MurR/RpiR family transcriptional regulator
MAPADRQIGQFIIDNPDQMLRLSSAALAIETGRSQSSVVKFSQKLGFKGYPDLKLSVGEEIARSNGSNGGAAEKAEKSDPHAALAESLWHAKAKAEEETRLINTPDKIDEIAGLIGAAGKVFLMGSGADSVSAQAFAAKLSLLGFVAVFHADPVLMSSGISTVAAKDVLLVLSEHGQQPMLSQICRQFRERRGKVISVTRHTANPLRAHADASLLVSAHDERAHIEPLLYQSALQHLLDLIFVLVCEDGRLKQLDANLERVRHLQEP